MTDESEARAGEVTPATDRTDVAADHATAESASSGLAATTAPVADATTATGTDTTNPPDASAQANASDEVTTTAAAKDAAAQSDAANDVQATEAATASSVALATANASTLDAGASPPDNARVRNALEAIKTAIVWLVVIQLLTILSPLLRVSLKWTLIVSVVLLLGGFSVGGAAYLKAHRAQRSIPE